MMWPGIRKCLVWALHAEIWTHSLWKDDLQVAVELSSLLLNFIVLDVELCEIKSYKEESNLHVGSSVQLVYGLCRIRCGKHFCTDFYFLFSFHLWIWFFSSTLSISYTSMSKRKQLSGRLLSSEQLAGHPSKPNVSMVLLAATQMSMSGYWYLS